MSETSEELISYYKETLISQYFNKPKAFGTIGALIGGSGELGLIANAISNQVRDGFDLDTATGVQLDTLGLFRGVSRTFFTLNLSKTYLQLLSYDNPGIGSGIGISDYDDLPQPPFEYIFTYYDFVPTTLQDGDFRRVIKFLAAVHSSDFTYGSLDEIMYTFFIGSVNLIITGNMEITYQHLTSDPDDLFSIIDQMDLLPTPAGVTSLVSEVANF